MPAVFAVALGDVLSPLSAGEGRFEDQLPAAARRRQVDDEAQMESEFSALRPIEQAVLWRLLEQGCRFRPYVGEALKFYKEKLNAPGKARQRAPALVWKSARGEYSVDDAMMHAWYAHRVVAGAWPPKGAEPDESIAAERA